jgi:hypothetical protein
VTGAVNDVLAGAAPVAVWDARDDAWFRGPFTLRAAWLKSAGLPVHKLYRIEFYLLDAPAARIWCYQLTPDGLRTWAPGHTREPHDHDRCGPWTQDPRVVVLAGLPPPELL